MEGQRHCTHAFFCTGDGDVTGRQADLKSGGVTHS